MTIMSPATQAALLAEHEAVRKFLACGSIRFRRQATHAIIYAHQAAAETLAAQQVHHGVDCEKAVHNKGSFLTYGHHFDYDLPYLDAGHVMRCGRCHEVLHDPDA